MAADINALIDKHAHGILATAHDAFHAGKRLPPDAVQHMEANIQKMTPSVSGCQKARAVGQALDRIEVSPGG